MVIIIKTLILLRKDQVVKSSLDTINVDGCGQNVWTIIVINRFMEGYDADCRIMDTAVIL